MTLVVFISSAIETNTKLNRVNKNENQQHQKAKTHTHGTMGVMTGGMLCWYEYTLCKNNCEKTSLRERARVLYTMHLD